MRGARPETWAALDASVAALPAGTLVNINTASADVLAAAVPGSRRREARGVHRRARAQAVHDHGGAARAHAARCVTLPEGASFAFASSYFLVTVRSRQGDSLAQARALLKRDGRTWPTVVWQVLE